MKFTDVKIYEPKRKRKGVVLAFANIVLDNKYIIRGITLVENENGRFVSMPARKLKGKKGQKPHYRDMCHPLNQDVRDEMTDIIFAAYEKSLETKQ